MGHSSANPTCLLLSDHKSYLHWERSTRSLRNIALGPMPRSLRHWATSKGYHVPSCLKASSLSLPLSVVCPFYSRVMRGLTLAHLPLPSSVPISFPEISDTLPSLSVCPRWLSTPLCLSAVIVNTAPSCDRFLWGTPVPTSVGASSLPPVLLETTPTLFTECYTFHTIVSFITVLRQTACCIQRASEDSITTFSSCMLLSFLNKKKRKQE